MEVAAVAPPLVKLLPKLLSVVDVKRKQLDGLEVDAGFIRRDLQSIQEYVVGRPGSCRRSVTDLWIRFASQICKLRKRSKDMLDQLLNCINAAAAAAAPDSDPAGVMDPEEELVALLRPRSQPEGS